MINIELLNSTFPQDVLEKKFQKMLVIPATTRFLLTLIQDLELTFIALS